VYRTCRRGLEAGPLPVDQSIGFALFEDLGKGGHLQIQYRPFNENTRQSQGSCLPPLPDIEISHEDKLIIEGFKNVC
jgi:hypothetical protein